ncbi:MAG TPA: nucleoside-diphosphate kinase [Aggregatilinea sp.]|uniref:nucleoside-diphosphate kinase n=1 Tax=Aggregatilinea sp. TaxID=2806333 RepID=UPI002B5ACEF6|nr:nucleoside-diphosphate kinase [Aggregatilinea sp.]HML20071.1 nucleoside-diphosphate kinase [Aggregatilinea sp.]
MERTLIIIKPDAVQRGLIGEIIRRFENRGLRIAGMKFMLVTREIAARHYAEHEGKGFYEGLIDYITSGPVVVMALEGKDAINIARNTIGKTKPVEAAPGTIRGDFGMEVGRNLVHGSDKPESAERELGIFFDAAELYDWTRDVDRWIFEN